MQEKKSPNGHFCDRLDITMAERSLNGADLARITGLTPTAISRYRQGRVPAAEELLRLSDALGVDMKWLLTGDGSGPRAPAGEASAGTLRGLKAEAEKLARQLGEAEATLARLRSFLG